MDKRRWEGESVIMDYNGMDLDYRMRGVRVQDIGLSGQIWKAFSDSNQPQSRVLKEYDGRYSSLSSLFSFPLCSQATKIPKCCPFCSPYRPSVSRVSLPLGSFQHIVVVPIQAKANLRDILQKN